MAPAHEGSSGATRASRRTTGRATERQSLSQVGRTVEATPRRRRSSCRARSGKPSRSSPSRSASSAAEVKRAALTPSSTCSLQHRAVVEGQDRKPGAEVAGLAALGFEEVLDWLSLGFTVAVAPRLIAAYVLVGMLASVIVELLGMSLRRELRTAERFAAALARACSMSNCRMIRAARARKCTSLSALSGAPLRIRM